MGLIDVSPSASVLESLTRNDILKRFLRSSGLGVYGSVASGSTSTIVANRLRAPFLNEDSASGWVYILKDAGGTGAAPEGEISPILEFEPGVGELKLTQYLTIAAAASDEFAIFDRVHPQDVLDHLDDLLKEDIYTTAFTFLTEAADGDMEQSGISDWTASSATVTKNTTLPMVGDRDLSVAATSGNGYAQQQLRVVPGKSYHLSAMVKTDNTTSAKLQAWDATNSAEIKSYTTSSGVPVRAFLDFQTPATCKAVQIRLITVTSGQTVYWDEVVFYAYETRSFTAPWWIKDPDQSKGVFRLTPSSIGTSEWEPSFRGELDSRWDYRDATHGGGRSQYVARIGYPTFPVFVWGTRNHTAYSNNNSEQKRLSAKLVNAGLCFRVFQSLASYSQQGAFNMDWIMNRLEWWETQWDKELRKFALHMEHDQTSSANYFDFYRNTNYRDPYSITRLVV